MPCPRTTIRVAASGIVFLRFGVPDSTVKVFRPEAFLGLAHRCDQEVLSRRMLLAGSLSHLDTPRMACASRTACIRAAELLERHIADLASAGHRLGCAYFLRGRKRPRLTRAHRGLSCAPEEGRIGEFRSSRRDLEVSSGSLRTERYLRSLLSLILCALVYMYVRPPAIQLLACIPPWDGFEKRLAKRQMVFLPSAFLSSGLNARHVTTGLFPMSRTWSS